MTGVQTCALPISDEVVGQVVIATISLRDGAPPDAVDRIRDHVVANGPPYMTPREIVVVDELPKGATGKIDRPAIARAYAER